MGGREIPDLDLVNFTFAGARELGDKPALIDGVTGEAVGYGRLDERIRALAAGLAGAGSGGATRLLSTCPTRSSTW